MFFPYSAHLQGYIFHTSSHAASAAQTIREESLHLRFFSVKL